MGPLSRYSRHLVLRQNFLHAARGALAARQGRPHRARSPMQSLPMHAIKLAMKYKGKTKTATATAVKRREKQGHATAGVGGTFTAYKSYENHFKPSTITVLKTMKTNFYTYNEGFVVSTGNTTGFQCISSATGATLYNAADLQQCYLDAASLDQMVSVPGGTSGQYTMDVHHIGAKQKVLITNAHNGPANLTIYDILAKRDSPAQSNTPNYAWRNGLGVQQTTNIAGSELFVGSVPTTSADFRAFYKIAKKTTVVLPAGSTHTHFVNIKKNKKLPNWFIDQWAANLGANDQLKGWYYHTMIVAHGFPVDSASSLTSVSTDQVKLNVVTTKSYIYKVIPTKVASNVYNTALLNFNDAQLVTEESNTVVAGANA